MSYIDLQQIVADKDIEPDIYEEWKEALLPYGDIDYMATLRQVAIPEDEWEEYAQDYAEDIGAIHRVGDWPANHIDWEAAANELKIDYFEVEVDGTTYYLRA